MFKDRGFVFVGLILLVLMLGISACKDSGPGKQGDVLMKIGDRVFTVTDFQQAFEMAMAAYPMKALTDPNNIKVAKVRLLNQMTDELVILKRADELQLTVSDEELDAAVNNIIKDYPDQTFDQILIEQSISFNRWKESLKKRLLIEKTIQKDTLGLTQSTVDSNALVEPMQEEPNQEAEHPPGRQEGTLEEENNTESRSAQDVYAAWMTVLRKTHPVFIDKSQWEKIIEE
jgi:hypothetical protein